jgi:DNA-binding NarL/FixJ family response regulator
MARVLIIHPSPLVRASHRSLLQAGGWSVQEATGRTDALSHLAGPSRARWGDLVVIDLSNWSVPGTALVRALRRQATSALPVLVLLPQQDPEELSRDAARRAGANLILGGQTTPMSLLATISLLTDRPVPALARLDPRQGPPAMQQLLQDAWLQQQELLALPDLSAPTVLSARHVFETLLARREDDGASEAAQALTGLAGGPRPLARWASGHSPCEARHAAASSDTAFTLPLLLVESGGQRYGFRLDSPVAPACWWTDGAAAPATTSACTPPMALNRLLGETGFRRLLASDCATVVFRHVAPAGDTDVALRVDDVLGLHHVLVQITSPLMGRASGCVGYGRCDDGQPLLVLDTESLMPLLAQLRRIDATLPR